MRRHPTLVLSLASTSLLSTAAHDGALLPCLTSTQSANGKVLVTDTLGFDDPDETHPRRIVSSVYQVYRRYTELNEGLRLNGPNTYWADPFWKVEFSPRTKSFPVACSYVLVQITGSTLSSLARHLALHSRSTIIVLTIHCSDLLCPSKASLCARSNVRSFGLPARPIAP